MKNKIFISGASKGIGLAIAERFHKEGWQVMICARDQVTLDAVAKKMPGLITYSCDVSDKAAVKALAAKIREEHGRLDILVNNAGVFLPGQMHDEDDSVLETQINTNLYSAYYMTKALLPDMKEAGRGAIVNMCSIASITAYAHGGSYSVSKFALLGFSKSLREEMKPHGVRVISVLPGATYTASWEGVDVPEERMMPASDVAELVWTACALSSRTVVEDIVIRPQLGDL